MDDAVLLDVALARVALPRCVLCRSAGGHGPIPVPEALSVTLKRRVRQMAPDVTFEGVPVPEELRRK